VLAQVQHHGSSSWAAAEAATEKGDQADESSSSSSDQAADQRRQLHQAIPIRANALNVRPGLQASSARPASWATASITPSVRGFGIPKTFLGISHEWTNVEELNQPGAYLQLIQDLVAYGGGPLVVRVGGGSSDQQTAPAPASTWNELRQLQYKTGEQQEQLFVVSQRSAARLFCQGWCQQLASLKPCMLSAELITQCLVGISACANCTCVHL
jgi:hypothetical protein